MDVDAVNSLSSGNGKASSSPRDGCFKCGGAHFQRGCNARKGNGKQSSSKGKQSNCGPRVRAKEKVRRTRRNPKESPKEPKVPKAHTRVKHRYTGLSGLDNSKTDTSSETQETEHVCITDNSWCDDGWSCDEWNDDRSSVGWHEGCETHDNSASPFSLGSLYLDAMSNSKRSEWVKMDLDTGAAVNTFPLNFGPDGAGAGRFCRTASVNGFLMVELGSFRDTMKTFCSDLRMEDSLVYTKCCAVLQGSRAKDDNISTWDMTVDT